MALVKCPECGKGISNKAKACPNCGYPLETEESIISIVPEGETNIEYNCPYCNAAVNENDEYCDDCGMRITPYIEKNIQMNKKLCIYCKSELNGSHICTVCGKESPDPENLKEDMMYCPECGELNKIGSFSCIHCGRKYKVSELSTCILKTNAPEVIMSKHVDNLARCPKCGSTSLSGNKKGFGIGKAIAGAYLAGPLGLMAGNIGAKKIWVTCMKCGKRFKI
ncbi:double zinc ribbon domain-containing protein [Robinsoniella peoriensis]|uniref:double zinc ribbon domain-containing protein n=1 Tax=Robinsoniella peoriensis TaxID=180332 RepID=UPI003625FB7A